MVSICVLWIYVRVSSILFICLHYKFSEEFAQRFSADKFSVCTLTVLCVRVLHLCTFHFLFLHIKFFFCFFFICFGIKFKIQNASQITEIQNTHSIDVWWCFYLLSISIAYLFDILVLHIQSIHCGIHLDAILLFASNMSCNITVYEFRTPNKHFAKNEQQFLFWSLSFWKSIFDFGLIILYYYFIIATPKDFIPIQRHIEESNTNSMIWQRFFQKKILV